MRKTTHHVGVALCVALSVGMCAFVVAPRAFAVSILPVSYGGRIAALVPCFSALGPSVWVQLVPASPLFPPFEYIWTPATLWNMTVGSPSIPPSHIGQQTMGRFDIPFVCFVGNVPLHGLREQVEGNSLI